MITEEMHNFNLDDKDIEIVVWLSLVQSSVQMGTLVSPSREG